MTADNPVKITEKKRPVGDGTPGPGRPKGVPNKSTRAVKEALVLAFEGIGGVPALATWAKKNRSEFYKLWGRMLPLEVSGPDGGPVQFEGVIGVIERLTDAERVVLRQMADRLQLPETEEAG